MKRAVEDPGRASKLSPYFSSIGHMAHQLAAAGADGLVLFNRFYQPDFDLATLSVKSDLQAELELRSGAAAALDRAARRPDQGSLGRDERRRDRGAGRQVPAGRRRRRDDDLGAAAPRPGVHAATLVAGLAAWLDENGHPSVSAIRGLKIGQLDDAGELLRAQYMHLLTEYVPRQLAS